MQQVFKSFYSLIDEGSCQKRTVFLRFKCENIGPISPSEAPEAAEFLQKRLISEFFGFQWQNLAEILSLFKKYNNLRKVAVREKV